MNEVERAKANLDEFMTRVYQLSSIIASSAVNPKITKLPIRIFKLDKDESKIEICFDGFNRLVTLNKDYSKLLCSKCWASEDRYCTVRLIEDRVDFEEFYLMQYDSELAQKIVSIVSERN